MSKRIVEISPSVLGADLMRLGEEIKMAESLGIHWLHLDNMDGHFAPNISFGPDFVRAIRKQTKLFLHGLGQKEQIGILSFLTYGMKLKQQGQHLRPLLCLHWSSLTTALLAILEL